eukprot:Pgem_evm1s16746
MAVTLYKYKDKTFFNSSMNNRNKKDATSSANCLILPSELESNHFEFENRTEENNTVTEESSFPNHNRRDTSFSIKIAEYTD